MRIDEHFHENQKPPPRDECTLPRAHHTEAAAGDIMNLFRRKNTAEKKYPAVWSRRQRYKRAAIGGGMLAAGLLMPRATLRLMNRFPKHAANIGIGGLLGSAGLSTGGATQIMHAPWQGSKWDKGSHAYDQARKTKRGHRLKAWGVKAGLGLGAAALTPFGRENLRAGYHGMKSLYKNRAALKASFRKVR